MPTREVRQTPVRKYAKTLFVCDIHLFDGKRLPSLGTQGLNVVTTVSIGQSKVDFLEPDHVKTATRECG
jgi:hypothetical protein